jgi:hypothetical protein
MSNFLRRTVMQIAAVVGLAPKAVLAQTPDSDSDGPSSEGALRKARSIARLKQEGVPTIEWLPRIEDSREATIRSKEEVIGRTCALMLVAFKGAADQHERAAEFRAALGDLVRPSPEEIGFLDNPKPTEAQANQLSWGSEAALPLLWSLGMIEMGRPEAPTDPQELFRMTVAESAERLRRDGRVRPSNEILDQADLIFRYHWAVRNASLEGRTWPAGLNGDVVMERHKALNWLIGYGDNADWDDVTTDT